jgi:two-component system, response regulator RegA
MKTPSRSVLVVDDESCLLHDVVRALEVERYEVHPASSCAEAFRVIETQRVDCAVVDLMLRDGSGLDILRRLKEAFADAHVVLLTGSIPTAMEAVRLGASDYLIKPVHPKELVSALDPASEGRAKRISHLPTLDRIQWDYIQRVLAYCGGNISESARRLGIHRQSLQRMLRRHPPRL